VCTLHFLEEQGMWLVSVCPVGGSLPFELRPGEFIIGRAITHPISIWDTSVSKTHAKLTVDAKGNLRVEHLGSRNCVDVNGKPIARSEVRLRDRIRFGSVPCMILAEPLPRSFRVRESQGNSDGSSRFRIDAALSPPQRAVLALLVQGLSEADVAETSGRSYHTVHNHVRVIYRQFNVHSRSELLAKLHGHR
jgi:DNA-binding CsgD family transcriptional regulator